MWCLKLEAGRADPVQILTPQQLISGRIFESSYLLTKTEKWNSNADEKQAYIYKNASRVFLISAAVKIFIQNGSKVYISIV